MWLARRDAEQPAEPLVYRFLVKLLNTAGPRQPIAVFSRLLNYPAQSNEVVVRSQSRVVIAAASLGRSCERAID